MQIGVVPDPYGWEHWEEAKALLEPAAKRGGVPILEEHEQVFAVLDGGLLAAATARMTVERYAEVILVGGRDCDRWLEGLDKVIGACASAAGATELRACGRRGWLKKLSRLGWAVTGERDGFVAYARPLGVNK